MSVISPAADGIEVLLGTYAELRSQDQKTPLQILASLQDEIDQRIDPNIVDLNRKAIAARMSLDDFVRDYVRTDNVGFFAAIDGFADGSTTFKTISEEAEALIDSLEALPIRSPKRLQLDKAIGLRLAEMDLTLKRSKADMDTIEACRRRADSLAPKVRATEETINGLQNRFRNAKRWLTFWKIASRFVRFAPIAIALALTLLMDRTTQALEWFAHHWWGVSVHDWAMFSLVPLQIFVFAPGADWLVGKACWGSLDSTIRVLTGLLPEVRAVELRLKEAEEKLSALYASLPAKKDLKDGAPEHGGD